MDIIGALLKPVFDFYKTKHYKLLLLIPLVLSLISLFFIPKIPQGVELRGGILISVQTNGIANADAIESALDEFGNVEVKSFTSAMGNGLEIEIPLNEHLSYAESSLKQLHVFYSNYTEARLNVDWLDSQMQNTADAAEKEKYRIDFESNKTVMNQKLNEIKNAALEIQQNSSSFTDEKITSEDPKKIVEQAENIFSSAKENFRTRIMDQISANVQVESYSFKEVGPALSTFFLNKTQEVVLQAIALTTIAVFLLFRKIAPTIVIMLSTLLNLLFALGAMGLFGVPLTLASMATLLMLIGLSLDTTILIGIKVFKKREGDLISSVYNSEHTSYTMLVGLLISFIVLLLMGIVTNISTYYEIAFVALAGVFADAVNDITLCDVVILWFAEREKKK